MKKLYFLTLVFSALLLATTAQAQTVKRIPASANPSNLTNLTQAIMGDTIAGGARADVNTIYELDRGGVYIVTGSLVNNTSWDLQIRATGNPALPRPAILRVPNASGNYPVFLNLTGNVYFEGIHFIGQRGPLEEYDFGTFRFGGDGTRIVIKDCIIEKDRGSAIQVRGTNQKYYIENSIFRNHGNRRIRQGNGRAFDSRSFPVDTLIIRNTLMHNLADRVLRTQGGEPINYLELDHNTIFNVIGRHGCIQLGKVKRAIITNNIFMNPLMIGTTPFLTEEQLQPDKEKHFVISLDTILPETNLTMASNNIFFTEDVVNYWASNDSVSAPGILSALVLQALGNNAADAFFTEVIELNNIPPNITQFVIDQYANPAATDMFDIMVEDVTLAGTAFDNGNLFNFANADYCYNGAFFSARAATDGRYIGSRFHCSELISSTSRLSINNQLALQAAPNPAYDITTFRYNITRPGNVRLTVYDLLGRIVTTLVNENQPAGEYVINWNIHNNLKKGLHIVRLQTPEGEMSLKILLQ